MTRVLLPARCGAVPAHLVLRVLVALQCVRSEAWSGIKMSALNPMANIQGAFCVMHPLRACAVWQGVEACALWHGVCGMVCVLRCPFCWRGASCTRRRGCLVACLQHGMRHGIKALDQGIAFIPCWQQCIKAW